jgi:predicted RNase H-like HicB family nuclease
VGNALAQGIIIRDGLYTSTTPEEEAGEWQWMRFSAAASPGNSGGPLLDKDGNVIGIVLRKSENENLNYALPIAEVMKAPANVAVIHMKMKYVLDNMDMTKVDTFHKEISLPKTYEQLDREATQAITKFTDTLLKKLLAENRQNVFPNGKGSTALLNINYNAIFPHVIMKDEDGNWDAFFPKDTKNADLGNNGYLSYGGLGSTYYFLIHKPDDVSMRKFTGDSKLFMDLILKGAYVSESDPKRSRSSRWEPCGIPY